MWLLFAQAAARKRDPFREPEVIWGTIGLIVALLVGAFCVWLVDRWRKKSIVRRDASEELTDFREMHESGEITDDEYARLRGRVADRVKQAPPAQASGPAADTRPGPAGTTEPAPPLPPPQPPSPPAGGGWPGASI
jgi:hypothetical protein